ncbi:MAG TPA: glycosyltransferase [Gammaproteobacteria bacterium]|nr:glycosyltransferase [Gammaproteobacteria bacterium]
MPTWKPRRGAGGCGVIGWLAAMGVWLGLGLLWWVVSLKLVGARSPPVRKQRKQREREQRASDAIDMRRISIFKPVGGPLDSDDLRRLRPCLESFAAELDEDSEMLIGIMETDRASMALVVDEMRAAFPRAQIKLVVHASREDYPNHKISVMQSLARHASGELWFWSDADMEAPPGMVRALRQDFAVDGTNFVTSPYIVRETRSASDVLDQLFVNVEFYPGTVLLGRLDLIGFGFGSGLLFEAARFKRHVDWEYLGSSLADDYHLGRLLGSGRLGGARLATVPCSGGWGSALLHYLRWHKTIRWCRPASYAAQLFVLPSVGTLLSVLCYPVSPLPWLALAGGIVLDCAAAAAVCHRLGSSLPWRHLPAVAAWSVARGVVWMACWLPWPIVWRGQKWWSPHPQTRHEAAALDTNGPPPGAA